MRQLLAFMKKEYIELVRTGRIWLLLIISALFGIMNPLFAKLTPWLMHLLSSELAESGMTVGEVKIDALTSWTQFYKNVPMLLLIFILLFSGILTSEYQRGTLVNVLTKGLQRWKVVVAKGIAMLVSWTCGYWLCYGITYGYNAYFWDNSVASHVFLAAFSYYLLGVWLLSLILLFSVFGKSNYVVLLGVGGFFAGSYLLGVIPKMKVYVPTQLSTSMSLLTGVDEPKAYVWAFVVTGIFVLMNIMLTIHFFNKKAL